MSPVELLFFAASFWFSTGTYNRLLWESNRKIWEVSDGLPYKTAGQAYGAIHNKPTQVLARAMDLIFGK